VGIAAVAVAAAGVTDTTTWNLAAIPFSAVGACWSWRSRRRANTAVKFAIALGMILALAFFLMRLLSIPGDTRIILAELLIQLQVLHSFDLPRRKDLGYSMMIGLILIGVAATISQTLLFGPLLLLFLILALPVLLLDYRSRLGLLGQQWRTLATTPRQLAGVLLVVLLLGLLIFAALPRLPGYQLRAFPVSGSVETDTNLDGRQIFNPGYISSGNENRDNPTGNSSGGSGEGQSPETGPGSISTDFYYGFNRRMNQNLRGSLIPKVVMRVRSQAPGFWRVMAFDQYTGQGWEVSRNDDTTPLIRSRVSYQFLPPRIPRLGASQEVVQTYTLVNDFQNLIPALYEPKEVYFPTETLAIDPEGALRSPKSLVEGLTYTVVSEVPQRNPILLRQAQGSIPANIQKYYLQMPPQLQARLQQETERLLATAPEPLTNPFDQAQFLAQTLRDNYSLRDDLPFFEKNEDLVEAFLFKYQGGTADHFPTVLTMMLRSLGIPARLMAGFGTGQFNPFTGFYIVRNTDAYAMTEVYFPEYGWFSFDPIPGHMLLPPSVEDYNPFSILRQIWNWLEGLLPAAVVIQLQRLFKLLAGLLGVALGVITRMSGQGWLSLLWGVAALIGVSFLLWLSYHAWRSWQRQRWLQQLPAMERVYQQLLQQLALQGYAKAPHQTPLEYVQTLRQNPSFTQLPIVADLIQAYVRWRYGGEPQNLDQVRSHLQQLRKTPPKTASQRKPG
jgi:transglutaminase-like putative cysteine protease